MSWTLTGKLLILSYLCPKKWSHFTLFPRGSMGQCLQHHNPGLANPALSRIAPWVRQLPVPTATSNSNGFRVVAWLTHECLAAKCLTKICCQILNDKVVFAFAFNTLGQYFWIWGLLQGLHVTISQIFKSICTLWYLCDINILWIYFQSIIDSIKNIWGIFKSWLFISVCGNQSYSITTTPSPVSLLKAIGQTLVERWSNTEVSHLPIFF